ncbi:MAG: PAS domain S-box protein [Archaeoglobaceae archaeon]
MQKDKLLAAVLELEKTAKPGAVEEVLKTFGRELLVLFDLDAFIVEVPLIELLVKIPENASCEGFSFEGAAIKVTVCGDIDGKLEKILRDILKKLDDVVLHSVYYEFTSKVFERSTDAIFIVDRERRVLQQNKKAREIFGNVEKLPEFGSVCEFGGKFYSVAEYDFDRVKAVVLRDVTKIKRLEEAAKESEEMFRTLAEATPVAVLAYTDERFVFANRAAEEITGYSRDELLSGIFWELFPEDEKEKVKAAMQKRLSGETVEPYVLRIRRKDGKEKIVQVYGSTAFWKGRRVGIVAISDVTRIVELEEKYRKIVESSPNHVAVVDLDGRFVEANPAMARSVGTNPVGKTLAELFDRDTAEDMLRKVREAIEKGSIVEAKEERDERVFITSYIPLEFGGVRRCSMIARDVTKIEEERKRLEELTKMLELINSILRHDVLNALTSARAFLEVYEEEKDESILEKVKAAIDRAVSIIRNVRSFEQIVKRGELRVVSVKKFAEDVAKNFDVPISVEGDCEVLADEGLRTIFENIFQNAVQHGETDRIDVKIKPVGNWCEVRIADYGKGVPDEIKDKIFEEGFKHGPRASTGLGLYAVKKLVERYGGEVWVEDNKPHGAVFVLRLRRFEAR